MGNITFIRGFKDDYRFLSNFMYVTVEYDGVDYPTNEHAFQAAKFSDVGHREKIRQAETPQEAKLLGRSREFPMREGWDDGLAVQVMAYINSQKYQNPKYKKLLLDTGDAILVETNHWGDNTWGDDINTPERGRNQLGLVLMSIREAIREAEYLSGSDV